MVSPAVAALARVVGRKAGGARRAGQEAMCGAVEVALKTGDHLLVEAPTGTGKSLAYLVASVLFATTGRGPRRVVVVTATKALQEQLVGEDLPFLAEAMAPDGVRFSYAMLKGRSNYLCRAKLGVSLTEGIEARFDFGTGGPQAASEAVAELGAWADSDGAGLGDRAEAPFAPSDAVWSQVSVDAGECPGASRCSEGERCFAEAARDAAGAADIVVVNTHLYATHLATGGGVLPEHDAVVFDEAHALEATMSAVFGVRLSAGRVRRVASRYAGAGGAPALAARLESAAASLESALDLDGRDEPRRARPTTGVLAEALSAVSTAAAEASQDLRRREPADEVAKAKSLQAAQLADGLREDLGRLVDPEVYEDHVAWVEPGRPQPDLRLAAVDIGPVLAAVLYPSVTVVATSATLATAGRFDLLAQRLGLTRLAPARRPAEADEEADEEDGHEEEDGDEGEPAGALPRFRSLAVPSPFDHRRQASLYVPVHLPDPRDDRYPELMHEELHALITAAGGRTLALFTSRAAMQRAADALAGRPGAAYEVLVQDHLPRGQLLSRFRSGPAFAIFATQSFWSGIDLPGALCHLVTIDKVPFPRPTDPLVQARRQAAARRGEDAFATVDLPAAAMLLAQGAGRLVRSPSDEGVVAVLDRRLGKAHYRRTLLDTLPPFRRTVDRHEVVAILEKLADKVGRGGGI